MANPQPHSETRNQILAIIKAWKQTTSELRKLNEKELTPTDNGFSFGVYVESTKDEDLLDVGRNYKKALQGTPYERERLKTRLEQLLVLDKHLQSTCLTPWSLARAFDKLALNSIVPEETETRSTAAHDDAVVSHLMAKLFESSYSRLALMHLYNLRVDSKVELPDLNAEIVTIPEDEIPLITGEATFTSTLHPSHIGNTFLAFKDAGNEPDDQWMDKKWSEAWQLVQILKYVKYGIVDLDYAGIYFSPLWVNEIRRHGIYIWGRPRCDPQPTLYHLQESDLSKLCAYMKATKALGNEYYNSSSQLRKSITLAGDYFESHHTRVKKTDQLVDLIIALEALLSPENQGELTFRMSQGMAVLLAANATERTEIFQFIKRMYNRRSDLVHGRGNPTGGELVTAEDIARLGNCLRQCILRFLVFHFRGAQTRKTVHDEIVLATLDSEKTAQLQDRSDLEKFLTEKNFQ